MPYHRCIQAALDAKLLDDDEAELYNGLYSDREEALRTSMTPQEAAAQAAQDTFAFIEGEAAERRRQTFLSLAAKKDISRRLDGYKSYWTGNADPYLGATALYDRLVPGRGASGFSVEGQYDFWRNHAHSQLDQAWDEFGNTNLLARRNVERMGNIVEEVFAVDAGRQPVTGDAAARQLATAWVKVREDLRAAFNRFGGHIGKVEDYGFPQSWNRDKVRVAGAERFADAIAPRVIEKTIDRRTGQPFRDIEDLKTLLRGEIYTSIVTDGWSKREPTSAGGRALANRRAEHRFLKFTSAKDWFDAAQEFGEADPVNSMLSFVDGMSRDIALMQVMGPNPAATLRWLEQDLTRRQALADAEPAEKVKGVLRRVAPGSNAVWAKDKLESMHAAFTHSNAAPVHPVVADVVEDTGNILTAALLQAATLAAVPSDFNFTLMTRHFNHMPNVRILRDYMQMLNPLDSADRKLAIRITGLAQNYCHILHNQSRVLGEINGHKWSSWIADRVLGLTGLTAHTSAIRWANAMNTYAVMAQEAKTAFGALDEGFRDYLSRYRIGEKEWDVIRATEPYMAGKTGYIRPGDIYSRKDIDASAALDLAGRLADAANTELEFAVPSYSLAAQAIAKGMDRPGSGWGVIRRSAFMFKNFGFTFLLSHIRRFFSVSPKQKLRYGSGLLIGGTLAGAMTIQMRQIASGRDPRDMTDGRFWADSVVTGGGLGMVGDFAYAGLQGDTATGGLVATLAGPYATTAANLSSAVLGHPLDTPSRGYSPLHQNLPTRLLLFTKRNLPGGSLWYIRAAEERLIWDQLQEEVDPGWRRRVVRTERWYRQNFGNEFYWKRGEALPDRAPDPKAAFGGD